MPLLGVACIANMLVTLGGLCGHRVHPRTITRPCHQCPGVRRGFQETRVPTWNSRAGKAPPTTAGRGGDVERSSSSAFVMTWSGWQYGATLRVWNRSMLFR